ncbi:sugar transferase [Mucilaginibacter sp. SP1R1]|uniref:sugar transferase n=1 Tax=Mucilaginibacter sp. SP1R1 TaxID=2723091 RepID=UPI001621B5AD|nr:sugar transferase [Mucilaginibacter sp. SP1R1]MBB6149935.1 lipopolysaccharide/colanic/teichoic acid biosynthesis glycosyltransferase [Mucilaginibacter sp. SP1R1]
MFDEKYFFSKKLAVKASIDNKKAQLRIKRVLDIFLSIILIIILIPVWVVIPILIMLSSTGPALYSNYRVGHNKKLFRCLKFRSMIAVKHYNKEDEKSFLEAVQTGVLFKPKNDSRVNWIGKLIRKTSIDELPQLFNVLMGDMSIVGPRPLVPHMLHLHAEFNDIRSAIKPGITGKWQTENRINNTSASDMIEYDIAYIETFNLVTDLKILLKTPISVIKAQGAF